MIIVSIRTADSAKALLHDAQDFFFFFSRMCNATYCHVVLLISLASATWIVIGYQVNKQFLSRLVNFT